MGGDLRPHYDVYPHELLPGALSLEHRGRPLRRLFLLCVEFPHSKHTANDRQCCWDSCLYRRYHTSLAAMTSWFTDPDRVKVQWRLVYLNLSAVLMNLVIGLWTWKAMSVANFLSAAFSGWIAWKMYTKIPEIKSQQEKRILDYLKGSKDFG